MYARLLVAGSSFKYGMAISAFIYGYKNLPVCYEDGNNLEARGKMLEASCMAGIAFSNCALGIVHSIAHTFGAEYGVPHGLANAIVLPYGLQFNSRDERARARCNELAAFAGEKLCWMGYWPCANELRRHAA